MANDIARSNDFWGWHKKRTWLERWRRYGLALVNKVITSSSSCSNDDTLGCDIGGCDYIVIVLDKVIIHLESYRVISATVSNLAIIPNKYGIITRFQFTENKVQIIARTVCLVACIAIC